jgi:ribosomal protein S27AE
MSRSYSFNPARLVLSQPICPKCGSPMWLARIEPESPDHDKRTFECPQCENVVSEIIKYR